jgi:tetrahydromethanopterin S-methyltransferase subunit G
VGPARGITFGTFLGELGAVADIPNDIDSVRRILFGADLARLEQAQAADREAAQRRAGDMEQKVDRAFTELEHRVHQRLEELAQKVAAQLEELSHRQQAHAERATQLLDQVMAELARRTDQIAAETRTGFEELRTRAGELERRKLNVVEFGASLAALGQRFAAAGDEPKP